MASQTPQHTHMAIRRKWWLQSTSAVLLLALFLFASSGTFAWPMAWAYLAVVLVVKVENALTIDTDLMDERSHLQEGTKKWDIPLARFIAVIGPVLTLGVAGLDIRLGWSGEMNPLLQILGGVFVLVGGLLLNWAMAANRFFSATVRIQSDRGHSVASHGPYRFARHPGYVGAILSTLMTPLILGSWVAFIPAGLVALGYIIRTALEDNVLQEELEGYREYAQSTRYRLLPGIW